VEKGAAMETKKKNAPKKRDWHERGMKVHLWIPPNHTEIIRQMAEDEGLAVSTWIRSLAIKTAKRGKVAA